MSDKYNLMFFNGFKNDKDGFIKAIRAYGSGMFQVKVEQGDLFEFYEMMKSLPEDITFEEMKDVNKPWGYAILKVKNVEEKEYYVTMPIAGSVTIYIDATSKEEALKKFWEEVGKEDFSLSKPKENIEWDFEFHEKIVEGNVCHANPSEVEVCES